MREGEGGRERRGEKERTWERERKVSRIEQETKHNGTNQNRFKQY